MIDLSKAVDLPDSISVSGKSYRINTDYQFFILFSQMVKHPHEYKDYNFIYKGAIPADLKEGFEELKKFAQPPREIPRDIGDEPDAILIDYEIDADLIYSAFWQRYGIDLKEKDLHLHWYKFQALLAGLTETKLNKVMEYRAYNPKEGDNKEYKKYMLQMKAMWQIEKEYSDEEKSAIAKLDSLLKQ